MEDTSILATDHSARREGQVHSSPKSLCSREIFRSPLPYSAVDPSSIPGSGRCPEEGNDNSLQCSCLENPMDRGAWQAEVHGVAKS